MSEQFSGTKEVSEKLAFNLEDLNIYLEKKDTNIENILKNEINVIDSLGYSSEKISGTGGLLNN